jgi:uncharacterized membrane protein YoaT (DUF817 family)
MYVAVGSFIIQAWRLFDLRIRHHPPYWIATVAALLIYENFFTHHDIGDYGSYITALLLGLYARAIGVFRSLGRVQRMPLLLSFVLIGFSRGWRRTSRPSSASGATPIKWVHKRTVSLGKWSS